METATARTANDGAAFGINHKDMANAIRALAMDAVEKANSGQIGRASCRERVLCVV